MATKAPTRYKHPLEYYEQVYGVASRTISRYAKAGYPLDDIEATRALISTQKYQPKAKAHISAPGDDAEAPQCATIAHVGRLGLIASIERLREAEAQANADYLAATKPEVAAAKQKQWLALCEQLRKVEQSTPDIEESNKQSVKLSELKQALNELFLKLRQDLETLPNRIALELVGKDVIGGRMVLQTEVEEIISSLYTCKYIQHEGE